jgi:hypothetical protein
MTLDDFNLSLIYTKPSIEAMRRQEAVRAAAKSFATTIFREIEPSRERSLALTQLEAAAMYALKAIGLPRQERLDV